VLEANRIRRGGLGGFFATDLGVEMTVTTEDVSGRAIDGDADHYATEIRAGGAEALAAAALTGPIPRVDQASIEPVSTTRVVDDQPPVETPAMREAAAFADATSHEQELSEAARQRLPVAPRLSVTCSAPSEFLTAYPADDDRITPSSDLVEKIAEGVIVSLASDPLIDEAVEAVTAE
jgi:hypothetical protein